MADSEHPKEPSSGQATETPSEPPVESRRGEDRRAASERRRSARGLFELRARREGADTDRRHGGRREDDGEAGVRTWWGFWRRDPR